MISIVNKKKIGTSFLLGVAVITAYFSFLASYYLIRYSRLQETAPAKVTAWEIRPTRWGRYALAAKYEVYRQDKTLKGVTEFAKPYYLNKASAEDALRALAKRNWSAWVSGSGSIVDLEKTFPWDETLKAIISLGVMFYFIRFRSAWVQESSAT